MMHILIKLSNYGRKIFAHIIAMMLPPSCPACGVHLPAQEHGNLCYDCWSNLPKWNVETEPKPVLPKNIESLYAPLLYKDNVQDLIAKFKFSDSQNLAKLLVKNIDVDKLKSAIKYNNLNPDDVIIVPVPLHPRRLFKRMFNQSAFLALELGKLTGLKVDLNSLVRIKNTSPQLGKSATSRKRNLQGAFKVKGQNLQGKIIILVDDVWTTGSTAKACAIALNKTGVNQVHTCTIAYVPIGDG